MSALKFKSQIQFRKIQMNGLTKFILSFCFFILLIAFAEIIYCFSNHQYLQGITTFLTCGALIGTPVFLFHRNIKVYIGLLSPFVLLSIIDFFCITVFKLHINYDLVISVLNTDYREASELLNPYILYSVLLLLIGSLSYRTIIKCIPGKISWKKAVFISLMSVLFLVRPSLNNLLKLKFVQNIRVVTLSYYPCSLYADYLVVREDWHLIRQHQGIVKKFKFNAYQKKSIGARQIYVMMLGESSRFDHWGINKYQRQTSPKLAFRENLISFPNMISGGYITELSVPMLITRAYATDYDKHFHENSIVSAFKEGGFKTYWVSNSVDRGNILIHEQEADKIFHFGSSRDEIRGHNFDMELIGTLKKIISANEKKVFIVLHTTGSHYNYDCRYPDSYKVFKASKHNNNVNLIGFSNKESLIDSYDNSILYSDSVIDSAISIVKQTGTCSWVSYTSDHGEDLYDDSDRLSLHGSLVPSTFIAHVPWFLWTSGSYMKIFPDKVAKLISHKSLPLCAKNVFYTLVDLGNLSFNDPNNCNNIASANFKVQPQLILGGDHKVFEFKNFKRLN